MLLVDSHCHLDRLSYGRKQTNMADVLAKAAEQDVGYFLCVSVTQVQFPTMLEAIAPYPQVFASCGVHPLNQEPGVDAALLLTQAADERVVAIGETGLDYFYSPENKEVQQASFREHIRVARALNKPLIIHTRDAQQDTLQIMREEGAEQVGGVLHCFTESLEMAEAAMAMGFYISISGIATFKNAAALQAVVKALPLERLLVETDSPYLAPVPHRGRENEPAFVRDVAQFIADLRQIPLAELAQATSHNFFELFKLAKR
ncbi:metal-dependent hydrolase [Aeromonas hydrophila]|uniref:YchF/TatD family DNA exonuclease n=1 Tax=Aeromonas hydrophila TaxID=644 RepID=A0AAX3PFN4_AERHY|nr:MULTISPECIES: YchF/TatD family DNA exonuclease [Aeromonas]GKQ61430.1 DNAse [Aeromonas caviae]HDT5862814.1 YchF/TatD family DNA exonuclease [Aeromonas hydrophila subsp. hydrophila]MCO4112920.1 YchF/TatD family DNA exonuclease [Aeromonas hydrophila]MCV9383061.1 YchF/TatD family DNA exonuclease [Aeromonas hydrophila]MDD9224066.1 YchF/TatD family DNA exonuclease [Aeromonas hydrophila]